MTEQLTQDRTESGSKTKRHGLVATVLAATTLAVGAGPALAAPGDPSSSARDRDAVAERFDEARQNVDSLDEIGRVVVREVKVEEPRKEKREKPEPEPEYGTPESVGVSQSTLDSIAACESGGDPTVVDASGTYHGKYQFDLSTWASVGAPVLPPRPPRRSRTTAPPSCTRRRAPVPGPTAASPPRPSTRRPSSPMGWG